MGTRRIAALALLAWLTLAGCAAGGPSSEASVGNSTSPGRAGPGSNPAGSTPPGSTSVPSTLRPTGKPPSPDPLPGAITVRGTVKEGVELGCMILAADDGKTYLLLGGDRAVIGRGGRLEVAGSAQPGLMSTCAQGIPFKVTSVRAI